MKQCKIFIFLVIFLALGVSCNQADTSHKENLAHAEEVNQPTTEEHIDAPEASFLDNAYRYNHILIRYNQEAASRAGKRAIQNFAGQSAEYHQNLKMEIEHMAEKHSLFLSSASERMDQEEIQELSKKSDKEFDIAYLQALEDVQSKMVEKYEGVASTASDNEIRNWATKIISNLKAHQTAVKELLEEAKDK